VDTTHIPFIPQLFLPLVKRWKAFTMIKRNKNINKAKVQI
jgi:hypothetical protein